jgi:nitrate/nitrite transporter NarK
MIQSPPVMKDRNISIISIICVITLQSMPQGALALLLPRIRESLSLTYTQAGSLAAVGMLVYAILQIPFGYLSDRFQTSRLFFAGAIGTALLLVMQGLVQQYWQAMGTMVLVGIFCSLLFGPGAVLMLRLFKPEQRSLGMSLFLAGFMGGQIAVNLIGPSLAPGQEWRPVFIYFGVAGIIVSFIYLFFSRNVKQRGTSSPINLHDMVTVLKSKFMWFCNGIQFVRLAIFFGLTTWIPAYLLVEKGFPLQTTGFIVAGQFIIITFGNLFGGYIADKLGKPILVIAASFVILMITALLLSIVKDELWITLIIMINSICLASSVGPLFAMPIGILGPKVQGTITGMGNLFANIGGFAFTLLLGSLKDTTGSFQAGFLAIACICIAGLIFTWLAGKMRSTYLESSPAR